MEAEEKSPKTTSKSLPEKPKKKSSGFLALVLGAIVLVIGVALLIVNLNRGPKIHDAETLVATGQWQREDEPDVVWNFTEIGKGSLTTNAHTNDYDFIWSMKGDKLLVETDWLYKLNDEFQYKLEDGKLILNDNIVFVPAAE